MPSCPGALNSTRRPHPRTRKGKIARLPRHIRDYLNRHLDDGEPSVNLVQWLNAQPDTRRVLDEDHLELQDAQRRNARNRAAAAATA